MQKVTSLEARKVFGREKDSGPDQHCTDSMVNQYLFGHTGCLLRQTVNIQNQRHNQDHGNTGHHQTSVNNFDQLLCIITGLVVSVGTHTLAQTVRIAFPIAVPGSV